VVVLRQEPERTGHATASALDHPSLSSRHASHQSAGSARLGQGLGVTVAVDCHPETVPAEGDRIRLVLEKLEHEVLEEPATLRHALGAPDAELTVVVHEHGVARGFQEDDGIAAVGEQADVVLTEPTRLVEQTTAHGRPAAAPAGPLERHLETDGLQHLHGSPAHTRLVVAHPGVVPQDHPAPAGCSGP